MFMRSLIAFGALSILVGCAVDNPDGPDAEAQVSSSAAGVVVVERTGAGDAIVARFVRARQGAVDDAILRMAGGLDVPAAGTCTTSLDLSPPAVRGVDLLDVGAVTIDAPQGQTTVLLPRALPDPAGVVSGYFYSARTAEAFAPGARVSLRASGGQDMPEGFAVTVAAPRDLGEVRLDATATGLDVSWDAETSDARDLVYADVLAPTTVARCAANDVGRLAIPAATVAGIDEGSIVVHRVHREPLRARGIEPGEVRFDLSRTVSFRR